MRRLSLILAAATLATCPLRPIAAGSTADRCAGAPHRQFDFWLGAWDVRTPDGKTAGTNRIEKVSGGCALIENWSGASGSRGTSLNFYDEASGLWNQVWVDNEGEILRLSGTLDAGSMVLEGAAAGDRTTRHRITWRPLQGGRVRQHWESSPDGGKTWSTLFDGTYTRRGSP